MAVKHRGITMSVKFKVGGKYNFRNQPERLKYIGLKGAWHQFAKVGETEVWAEILDGQYSMMEKTKDEE